LQADAEDVFRRGVELGDQQAVVYENDASTQAVENSFGIVRCCAAVIAGALWAV
jgi:hypothetical protein